MRQLNDEHQPECGRRAEKKVRRSDGVNSAAQRCDVAHSRALRCGKWENACLQRCDHRVGWHGVEPHHGRAAREFYRRVTFR